jgi:hypothetical protein
MSGQLKENFKTFLVVLRPEVISKVLKALKKMLLNNRIITGDALLLHCHRECVF